MKLIGLAGPAGSGKTTIANYMVIKHQYAHTTFAYPIKIALAAMLDVNPDKFEAHADKEKPLDFLGVTPRRLMQTLGTEWGRNTIHPDIWLILMQRRIAYWRRWSEQPIVISDVRFPNEANLIRNEGGTIWHIQRSNNPYKITGHASENPVERQTGEPTITNHGSIDELYADIDGILSTEETEHETQI